VLQAHRWVDVLPRERRPVAGWVVAERLICRRGEHVGIRERVEVPVWDVRQAKFVLARDSGPRARPGVEGDFSDQGAGRPGTILVDFAGGQINQMRTTGWRSPQRVSDTAAPEVVLLTPEGRLLVRDGASDVEDRERQGRLEEYRKTVQKLAAPVDK